jgi:hypothetical protein
MLEMQKLRKKKYNKNEAHISFDAWLCVDCLLPNTSTTLWELMFPTWLNIDFAIQKY